MATATPLLSATISPQGTKIVIRGTRPELADFIGSLPSARWHRGEFCWTCDATPAAAARLAENTLAAVEFDDQARALVTSFHESTRRALNATLAGDLPQPATRVHDAWMHQLRAYHFANALPGALGYVVMGGGKSKVSVDLTVNNQDQNVLIMAPVSVLGVWRREFAKHAVGWEHQVFICDTRWPVKKRCQQAALFVERQRRIGKPAVVVVNYESVWRSEFGEWCLSQMWDRVIADESHRLKAHDSHCSKFAAKLYPRSGSRLGLSGTALANGPEDAFGQYRFLEPGIFGTSWHRFKAEFTVENPYIPGAIVDYKNQDEFARRFGLICYRVEGDVLDLPPVTHTVIPVSLCAKAAKTYRELEREAISHVKEGVITTANALVKLIRLAQATSGFSQLDDTKEVVDLGDDKAIALRDLLADFDRREPVVVFCRFRHDLDRVAEVAAQLGLRYGELSGRRHDLTEHATMPDWVELMGVQYQSGGVGVDFCRARYAAYYSATWSLAEFEQSIARLNRPGQTRPVSCYHLAALGTVDEQIAASIERKRDIVEDVLARMREAA